MTKTYKTEGIILKRANFGEADRLLTIFTKHYGKIKARAPGIRRTTSHKAPHLELFNHSTLFLVSGKNIDILTEAQTIDNFPGLRKDLKKIGVAYYFCELVDRFCPERQEHKDVFVLLIGALSGLVSNHSNDLYHWSENFANQLLWILGFLPGDKNLSGEQLGDFIENLIERKLKSRRLLRNL